MSVTGVLLCAGSAARMGFDKLTTPIGGRTAIERTIDLLTCGGCDALVIVASEANEAYVRSLSCAVPKTVVRGGKTRTESVRNGLTEATGDIAVIHDAARCFAPASCVAACIESAAAYGSGVLALPVADTVVRTDGAAYETLDRTNLYRTQTPQAFLLTEIRKAYLSAEDDATDDAALYRRFIGTPRLVRGSELAKKLTTPEDWVWAKEQGMICTKIGTGFDTHRLVEGRKLVLGGVEIPFEKGLLGHSDADVLLHAIADALLGAAALGDIGKHFPDTDDRYKGISSMILLEHVGNLLSEKGYTVGNVDATIVAQRPKMLPHIPQMRENIARALRVEVDRINVKATTEEHLGFTGNGQGISSYAVAGIEG